MQINAKQCSRCGETKPADAFHRDSSNAYGLSPRCKSCRTATDRARLAERRGDPEWRRRRARIHRSFNLRSNYGLSLEDYEAMWQAQGGLCAVCGQPEEAQRRDGRCDKLELAVDHNHLTGRIRSLLCGRCNGGLGQFREDPALLRAAAAYLERHAAG